MHVLLEAAPIVLEMAMNVMMGVEVLVDIMMLEVLLLEGIMMLMEGIMMLLMEGIMMMLEMMFQMVVVQIVLILVESCITNNNKKSTINSCEVHVPETGQLCSLCS